MKLTELYDNLGKYKDEIFAKLSRVKSQGLLNDDALSSMGEWLEYSEDPKQIVKFLDNLTEDVNESYEEEHGSEIDVDKGYSGGADYGEEDKALDDEDRAEMAEPLRYPMAEEFGDDYDHYFEVPVKMEKKADKILNAMFSGAMDNDEIVKMDSSFRDNTVTYRVKEQPDLINILDELESRDIIIASDSTGYKYSPEESELAELKKAHFENKKKDKDKDKNERTDPRTGITYVGTGQRPLDVKENKDFDLKEWLRKNPVNRLKEAKNDFSIKDINIVYTEEGQHYDTKVTLNNGKRMDVPNDLSSEELAEVLKRLKVYVNPDVFEMDYEADSSDSLGSKDLNKLKNALRQAKISFDIDRIDVS